MYKYTPIKEVVRCLKRPLTAYGYLKTLKVGDDYWSMLVFWRFYPRMSANFSKEPLNMVPVNGIMYPVKLFNVEEMPDVR